MKNRPILLKKSCFAFLLILKTCVMSSLLIRFFAFMLFLLFGLSFGWTVLLAGVIFLIAIGNVYWENILLGFLFDILFNFPFGFFTIIFSVILSAAVLLDDFFKSDAIFNRVARGVAASTSAAILFFLLLHLLELVQYRLDGRRKCDCFRENYYYDGHHANTITINRAQTCREKIFPIKILNLMKSLWIQRIFPVSSADASRGGLNSRYARILLVI